MKSEGTFYYKDGKLFLSCGCWFEFDSGTNDLFESEICDKHEDYGYNFEEEIRK